MNAQCILNEVPIGTSGPERVAAQAGAANAPDALRCTSARSTLLPVRCVCSSRDRESCIDKSSPTFARPAYTGALRRGVAVLHRLLVTYRYPHGAPRATAVPRQRRVYRGYATGSSRSSGRESPGKIGDKCRCARPARGTRGNT